MRPEAYLRLKSVGDQLLVESAREVTETTFDFALAEKTCDGYAARNTPLWTACWLLSTEHVDLSTHTNCAMRIIGNNTGRGPGDIDAEDCW